MSRNNQNFKPYTSRNYQLPIKLSPDMLEHQKMMKDLKKQITDLKIMNTADDHIGGGFNLNYPKSQKSKDRLKIVLSKLPALGQEAAISEIVKRFNGQPERLNLSSSDFTELEKIITYRKREKWKEIFYFDDGALDSNQKILLSLIHDYNFSLQQNKPKNKKQALLLKGLKAILHRKKTENSETIFSKRDRPVYSSEMGFATTPETNKSLSELIAIVYGGKEHPSHIKSRENPDSDFVYHVLKGDAIFISSFEKLLFEEINRISNKNVRNTPKKTELWWDLINRIIKNGNASNRLVNKTLKHVKIRHHGEDFSDWKRRLESQMYIPRLISPHDYHSLTVVTESEYFPLNMMNDKKTLSCTLGPKGHHKSVAISYELDPHIGLIMLVPSAKSSFNKLNRAEQLTAYQNSIGIAYVFRCIDHKNELAWLIDGVDAGASTEQIKDVDWREIFYKGIINAAKEILFSRKKPARVYFNLHVKNRSNKEFNQYIKNQGPRKRVQLIKKGGTDILKEYNLNPEHFIEAFHYKTGTVWTKDCIGIADVVEIDLESVS